METGFKLGLSENEKGLTKGCVLRGQGSIGEFYNFCCCYFGCKNLKAGEIFGIFPLSKATRRAFDG